MTNNHWMKKIVITGGENSGKTELAKSLAGELSWPLREELARTLLEGQEGYDLSDLIRLSRMNRRWESRASKREDAMICDTDEITLRIWAQLKFGQVPDELESEIFIPDLYILCYPDPMVELDDLREDLTRHKMLFDLYLNYLLNTGLPFILARGPVESRLSYTLNRLQSLLM